MSTNISSLFLWYPNRPKTAGRMVKLTSRRSVTVERNNNYFWARLNLTYKIETIKMTAFRYFRFLLRKLPCHFCNYPSRPHTNNFLFSVTQADRINIIHNNKHRTRFASGIGYSPNLTVISLYGL